MKYYVEVTLLPNPDITLYFLWEKLYQQVHIALVEMKEKDEKSDIGVSFPEYKDKYLGTKLRFFTSEKTKLITLNLAKWLSRLLDYVHITSIKNVPSKVGSYVNFYRINRRKSNIEKAKNTAERGKYSFEKALEKLEGRSEILSTAPFIRMISLSSELKSSGGKHRFKLVVGKKEALSDEPNKKQFNSYGLSATSSVPNF